MLVGNLVLPEIALAREFELPGPLPKSAPAARVSTGVPLMHAQASVPPLATGIVSTSQPTSAPEHGSLLNSDGALSFELWPGQVNAWKSEVHRLDSASAQRFELQVKIGESLLGNHEPDASEAHFYEASRHLSQRTLVGGLARYDLAIAAMREGRFADCAASIEQLIHGHAKGFDYRAAGLVLRHAIACAGYHEQRSAMGIPEPTRYDPLCGSYGFAASLRALHMPYDRATVLRLIQPTGEGNSTADFARAATQLGLSSHEFGLDDVGLRAAPKPLIAHVEHDHFITVLSAGDRGVTYLCSDCGPWPGGKVSLTWKQWKTLEADVYTYVGIKGSAADQALAELIGEEPDLTTAYAALTMPQQSSLGVVEAASKMVSLLKKHLTVFLIPFDAICGLNGFGQHCCVTCGCPRTGAGPGGGGGAGGSGGGAGGGGAGGGGGGTMGPGGGTPPPIPCSAAGLEAFEADGIGGFGDGELTSGSTGPSMGDPVNLATDEEEYSPSPDLEVYNPTGPSVIWARSYNSLLFAPINGFSGGWSHPYATEVMYNLPGASLYAKNCILLPNSGMIPFTIPTGQTPSASTPDVHCTVTSGTPLLVDWLYDSSTGQTYFQLTFKGRTKWAFSEFPISASNIATYISKLTDRAGNFINFNYGSYNDGEASYVSITSITDSSGVALLTLGHDSYGRFTSASDRYGRSVYYTITRYNNVGVPSYIPRQWNDEVAQVSEIVPTGTSAPPVQYSYGYAMYTNGESESVPCLHTLSVPSPTGTGGSTATINYSSAGMVSNTIDANGNKITFTAITTGGGGAGTVSKSPGSGAGSGGVGGGGGTSNETQVTYYNPSGTIVKQYEVTFNANMGGTSLLDSAGRTVSTVAYGNSATPYMPSSWSDNAGRTWTSTYDSFDNLTSSKTPKGTTTTKVYNYSNFALGELTSKTFGSKTPTTYTYYEPSGFVSSVSGPVPGTVGSPTTQTTNLSYDALGNLTSIVSPGNNAASTLTWTFNYTTDGGYTQPEGLGQPLTVTNSAGNTTHFRYDSQCRQVSATDALGNTETHTWNIAGQLSANTDPATNESGPGNAQVEMSYLYPGGPMSQVTNNDESGNLVNYAALGYGPEGELLTESGEEVNTTFTWDAAYRRLSALSPGGTGQQWTYDAYSNVSSSIQDGNTTQFPKYDVNGRLLEQVNARGQTMTVTYGDGDGLMTAVSFSAGASNEAFLFDAYDRPETASNGSEGKTLLYDDLDNIISQSTTYPDGVFTGGPQGISYTYNPDGSRKTMATPAGTFDYTYDLAQRLTALSNPFLEITSFSYLANNWLWTQTDSNGLVATNTYDARGLTTAIKNAVGSASVSAFTSIVHDGAGRVTSASLAYSGAPGISGPLSYSYGSAEYLASEAVSGTGLSHTYTQDANGNLSSVNGVSIPVNGKNQLSSSGFVYDADGNPTTYAGTSATFDAMNGMTALGSSDTYGYNAAKLRTFKQVGSARTYFLYDGPQAVCELSPSGSVTATNTFANRGLGLVSRNSGGSSTFYAFDIHDSTAEELSSSGAVLAHHQFDAFGNEVTSPTSTDPYDSYGSKLGNYRDSESGLTLMQRRYYDPAERRFVNRDPVGSAGGINVYAYCHNSVTAGADPTGFDDCADKWQANREICYGAATLAAALCAAYLTACLVDTSGGWFFPPLGASLTAGCLAVCALCLGIVAATLASCLEVMAYKHKWCQQCWEFDHPAPGGNSGGGGGNSPGGGDSGGGDSGGGPQPGG